ncbi:hypothetical protein Efla_000305 [Eimeria flavescens]
MARRLFIVTGANKGIGFQTARKLCQKLKNEDAAVLITSRCPVRGKEAVAKLAEEGLTAHMEQLDVTDEQSISSFAETVKNKYGEVDCLVNNAGFAFPRNATEPLATQARITCGVNYFGTRKLSQAISPLLRKGARVVNVASTEGQRGLEELSAENRRRLVGETATLEGIDEAVKEYLQACEKGSLEGWTSTTYRMSKAAVIGMTVVWARACDKNPEKEMIITCCCPGWCKTDMAGWEQPPLTASDGADVIVPLALAASREHQGKFVTKEGITDLSKTA